MDTAHKPTCFPPLGWADTLFRSLSSEFVLQWVIHNISNTCVEMYSFRLLMFKLFSITAFMAAFHFCGDILQSYKPIKSIGHDFSTL